MIKPRIFLLSFALLVIGLAAPLSLAEEGRIPIFEPTTITEPGSYIVTRDIGDTTSPVIEIVSSAGVVELDLNGFTVSRTNGTAENVIVASGLTSLKIRNGSIQRTPSSPFLFAGLSVSSIDKLVVEDVNFNRAAIIGVDNRNVTIRRNKLNEAGISLNESAATVPRTATIEDNSLLNDNPANGNGGIAVASLAGNPGIDLLIRNNRTKGTAGISLSAQQNCMIVENRVSNGSGQGISLGVGTDNCLVADNVVQRQGGDGIYIVLADGNKILNNIFSDNGTSGGSFGNGIQIEGGALNHLEGNVVNRNFKSGIWIRPGSVGNTYGRNMGSQNQNNAGACLNPAITTCPAPYGTGSAAPDLCDDGVNSKTLCDNMLPGPPRS